MGNFAHVGQMSLNGYERNNLFRNLGGGSWLDVGYLEGADLIEDGRGVAALDIENDGDLDLVVENYNQPARLLVNRGSPGTHWLELRLVGAGPARGGSNVSALGATALVYAGGRVQRRQVASSTGYLTGISHVLHFGLGGAASVDLVEVRWPSGKVERFSGLAVNRKHRLEEQPDGGEEVPGASPVGAAATLRAR